MRVYGVFNGYHGSGVYKTWPECQQEVHGCKGSRFKSFQNEGDALEWINMLHTRVPLSKTKRVVVMEEEGDESDDRVSKKSGIQLEEKWRDDGIRVWSISDPKTNIFASREEAIQKLPDDSLSIFTDGSNVLSHHGWAWYCPQLNYGVACKHGSMCDDGITPWTNNKSEITAIGEALEYCKENGNDEMKTKWKTVVVYTDSQYCVNALTKWYKGWFDKDFKPKVEDKKNLDLFAKVLKGRKYTEENLGMKVLFKYTPAHKAIDNCFSYFNDIVDRLARAAIHSKHEIVL
jgi:ribonuclease HI